MYIILISKPKYFEIAMINVQIQHQPVVMVMLFKVKLVCKKYY